MFFIYLFLLTILLPLKLDAYFQITPCDFVFLFLLHQCSPLVFWYLYLGSHHQEVCVLS